MTQRNNFVSRTLQVQGFYYDETCTYCTENKAHVCGVDIAFEKLGFCSSMKSQC